MARIEKDPNLKKLANVLTFGHDMIEKILIIWIAFPGKIHLIVFFTFWEMLLCLNQVAIKFRF